MSDELIACEADAQALKGRSGLGRIFYATGYSLAGLKAAYVGEAAFRQLLPVSYTHLTLPTNREV